MMDRYMEENRFLDASLMQIRQAPRQFATVEYVEVLGDEVMRQDAEIERLRGLLSGRARFTEIERLRADLAAAKALLRNVVARYDDYRGRGVSPAPNEYERVVDAIERIRAALGDKE